MVRYLSLKSNSPTSTTERIYESSPDGRGMRIVSDGTDSVRHSGVQSSYLKSDTVGLVRKPYSCSGANYHDQPWEEF